MRQIQRQLHGVQRRIEANKWQKSISELPEEEKHYRLCRDESRRARWCALQRLKYVG